MPPSAGALHNLGASLRLLRTRQFGSFWFASLASNIGTWAQQVAEPWLLLSVGASPLVIGLDAFALDAPAWLLTLVGGLLADRADRRRVVSGFQAIQMLCPTLLVVLMLTGHVHAWIVVMASLVVGITDALSMPSFMSIVPLLVPPEQIGAGLALNSTQFNLSRIAGPALAGVLMVGVGLAGCFVVSAASYVPLIAIALWIVPKRIKAPPGTTPAPAQEDTFDRHHPFAGVREVMRSRRTRGSLLTVLVTSLFCGPFVTFASVLVRDGFAGGAGRFSILLGAFGIGGLVGATGLLALAEHRKRLLVTWAAVVAGVLVAVSSLLPAFWMLSLVMVGAGAVTSASNTSANTTLQTDARPALRGQTVSLYMLAIHGGASLGSLITGLAIGAIGVRHALFADGLFAIAFQLVIRRACAERVR